MPENTPASPPHLVDPIGELRQFTDTETRVAIAGHPLHAMMVAFPIALCMCTSPAKT